MKKSLLELKRGSKRYWHSERQPGSKRSLWKLHSWPTKKLLLFVSVKVCNSVCLQKLCNLPFWKSKVLLSFFFASLFFTIIILSLPTYTELFLHWRDIYPWQLINLPSNHLIRVETIRIRGFSKSRSDLCVYCNWIMGYNIGITGKTIIIIKHYEMFLWEIVVRRSFWTLGCKFTSVGHF